MNAAKRRCARKEGREIRILPLSLVALAGLLAGCSTAHYVVNQPLAAQQPSAGYTLRNLERRGNTDSLAIVMTMSGGGYRAAALAYAVMEVLNETPIVWEGQAKTMLDEVDIISGVSGGSLTAAYFATHRDSFFQTFEKEVLGVDLQSRVLRRFLNPRWLWAQSSDHYGRGDLLQRLLDEHFFHGQTFGQLPLWRPMVFISATEIHFGQRFEFTQDTFDQLCSDLSSFPVSRAVAASMAVPVLISPVTVWNHMSRCPVQPVLELPSPTLAQLNYVHLSDGGLADNIGVRMPLELIAGHGGLLEATRRGGFRGVRKEVFIVVNAQPSPQVEDDDSSRTPGVLRQLRATVDVPINRSSVDGLGLLRAAVERWSAQLRMMDAARLQGLLAPELSFSVIEISLADVPDSAEFEPIRRMPTTLRISAEELAAMKRYARDALSRSAEWNQLLDELSDPGLRSGAADH